MARFGQLDSTKKALTPSPRSKKASISLRLNSKMSAGTLCLSQLNLRTQTISMIFGSSRASSIARWKIKVKAKATVAATQRS